MVLPILYSFRRCPYAMRARLAIAVANQQCELREVVLKNKPEAMLAISPKATVPVLQLADGSVIDESLEIMQWALAQSDPEGWLNTETDQTDLLIRESEQKFKPYLDRYKYFDRHPESSQSDYREQACVFLNKLEDQLSQHNGSGLCDQRLSLADYAIFPFVRQFAYVDINWFLSCDFQTAVAWEQSLEKSPLFLSVMSKYPAWETMTKGVLFPEHIIRHNRL